MKMQTVIYIQWNVINLKSLGPDGAQISELFGLVKFTVLMKFLITEISIQKYSYY